MGSPRLRFCRHVLLFLLLAIALGCLPAPRDVTNTPEIQSSGIVGECLVLKRDAALYLLGRPFPRLVVDEKDVQRAAGGPAKHVADLSAGTRLRIVKIVHAVTYDDGFFSAQSEVTFVRIESDPQAQQIVDMGGTGTPDISSIEKWSDLYARCGEQSNIRDKAP